MNSLHQPWKPLLAFCVVVAFSVAAHAAFPDKALRIVVPFAAGGGNDQLARALAPKLSELLGQPVIVDNKPGAAGNLGAAEVARAAPDGYTMLMATNQVVINPNLYTNIGFDVMKDLAPVGILANVQLVLAAHPSVPASTLAQLVSLGKKSPPELFFSSAGVGTVNHLAGVLFNNMTGTSLQHVSYRGTGPATADLVGGQVQLAFATLPTVKPHVDGGKLKAYGVTGAKRSSIMPNLATIDELGLKGFEASSWYGILVPASTPQPIIRELSAVFMKAMQDKQVLATLNSAGFEPGFREPSEMSGAMRSDFEKWGKVARQGNVKVD